MINLLISFFNIPKIKKYVACQKDSYFLYQFEFNSELQEHLPLVVVDR